MKRLEERAQRQRAPQHPDPHVAHPASDAALSARLLALVKRATAPEAAKGCSVEVTVSVSFDADSPCFDTLAHYLARAGSSLLRYQERAPDILGETPLRDRFTGKRLGSGRVALKLKKGAR